MSQCSRWSFKINHLLLVNWWSLHEVLSPLIPIPMVVCEPDIFTEQTHERQFGHWDLSTPEALLIYLRPILSTTATRVLSPAKSGLLTQRQKFRSFKSCTELSMVTFRNFPQAFLGLSIHERQLQQIYSWLNKHSSCAITVACWHNRSFLRVQFAMVYRSWDYKQWIGPSESRIE